MLNYICLQKIIPYRNPTNPKTLYVIGGCFARFINGFINGILGSNLTQYGELYNHHVEAWIDVWNSGHIDVVGNLKLAQAVYGSWYYILSSMPVIGSESMEYVGLSPSGLPYGEAHNVRFFS